MRIRIFFLVILLLTASCFPAFSQSARVVGSLCNAGSGEALDYAAVILSPSQMHALSDDKGRFAIENVPAGTVTLSVRSYGMEQKDTTLTLVAGKTAVINLKLKETNFRLDRVVVTATRNEAGSSTASIVSRQAMDHLQTGSLGDVVSFMPGAPASNPSLSTAQTIQIRTVNPGSDMNSLGTSILVDGAPVSNNANLQILTSAQTGSTSIAIDAPSVTSGFDVRGISTDNIESVEIIRGIPSAQYGDITSGTVIVKSKAGRSPWTVRLKANPNIYQASVVKGVSLGQRGGNLNLSGDYAYNRNSLTAAYQNYQRANAKALWSIMFGSSHVANTSISFNYARDRRNPNPDIAGSRTMRYERDLGVSLNQNGQLNINTDWLKSINWLVSGSFTDKNTHVVDHAINAMNLYSTAMTDGSIYSNVTGMDVYDSLTGKRITNDTSVSGRVLPYSYFPVYDIYGKEINAFAKLNADLSKSWGSVTDRILVGIDFKTDGNLGAGSVYDDAAPPFRSMGNAESGYRRRPYYTIPFVNQLGVYLEDSFEWGFAGRRLRITAGLRYDNVWSSQTRLDCLAPRINASIDIFPWMTLRGGWGITAKAPTSLYLNPNPAYHDAILYNGMYADLPEEQQLLVAKTTVYETRNPDLKMATNRKAEIGLDFTIARKYKIAITGYSEYMGNGYTFDTDVSSFKWYQVTPIIKTGDVPGSRPAVAFGPDTYNLFFETYRPLNSLVRKEQGVEYEINLGRFDAIRTSVYINGAWMRSSRSSNNYRFTSRKKAGEAEYNIAVYNPGLTTSISERFNTTLRLTHNIPEIGFAITLTGYMDWYTKSWNEYKGENMFVKYISRKDGKLYEFDPALKDDPEFSYMFGMITPDYSIDTTFPYVMFNLNLSKEIGDWLTASFYVNNLFNTRPLYRYAYNGTMTELGIPMFFGLELKILIK